MPWGARNRTTMTIAAIQRSGTELFDYKEGRTLAPCQKEWLLHRFP